MKTSKKTPVARNLRALAETDFSHMKSAGRKVRESIGLGNKRHMTAASLNKHRVFDSNNNKTTFITRIAAKNKTLRQQSAKANPLGLRRHKSVSGLIKRNREGFGVNQKANSVLNITKIATVNGLTRKIHFRVV